MSMYPKNMFFTSESVTEGTSGQILRPDLRRRAGRMPAARSHGACCLRVLRNDGLAERRWRDHDRCAIRCGKGRTGPRQRDRLFRARVRLRRQHRRGSSNDSRAVARHQPGRHAGKRADRGRRPGNDVRLRLQSNRRVDATADHAGAQTGQEADRRSQAESAAIPRAGRQNAGDRRIPRGQSRRASITW